MSTVAFNKSNEVSSSMWQVTSMLVPPIVLVTLIKLIHYAYYERRFKDLLPFIFMELNMLFVWVCQGTVWLYNDGTPLKDYTLE